MVSISYQKDALVSTESEHDLDRSPGWLIYLVRIDITTTDQKLQLP